MEHELKLWTTFWEEVATGRKRAEIRKNDRNFQPGDTIKFREYYHPTQCYTDRTLRAVITHVQNIRDMDTPLRNTLGLNPCMAQMNELAVLSIALLHDDEAAGKAAA